MAGCVGICCALSAELATLTVRKINPGELTALDSQTLLALSGMGAARASDATQRLIDAGASAVVSWGVAAALDSTLRAGDLILPQLVLSAAGKRFTVHRGWHAALCHALSPTLAFHTGTLVETQKILPDERRKLELSRAHNARAADMETASIALTARRAGIAFSVIRAISDTVSMTVPQSLVNAVDPVGQIGLRTVLTHIAPRPENWYRIARLGLGMRAACTTLKKAYTCTESELHLPRPMLIAQGHSAKPELNDDSFA
jgi:adenosylhomocysteine nucleosidase